MKKTTSNITIIGSDTHFMILGYYMHQCLSLLELFWKAGGLPTMLGPAIDNTNF